MPLAAADYYGSTRAPNFSTIGSMQHGLAPWWSRRSIRLGSIRTTHNSTTEAVCFFAHRGRCNRNSLRSEKLPARKKKRHGLGATDARGFLPALRGQLAAIATRLTRWRAAQPQCAKIKITPMELTDHAALRRWPLIPIASIALPKKSIAIVFHKPNFTNKNVIGCRRSGCRS